MSFHRLPIVSIVLVFGLIPATSVSPCTCVAPPTVEEALEQSTVVFLGTVSGTRIEGEGYLAYVVVDFLVDGAWKGPVTREYSIATAAEGGICGFVFLTGNEYLVYATEADLLDWNLDTELPLVHLCNRTKRSQWAEEDLEALGPYTPLPVTSASWGLLKTQYTPTGSSVD